MTPSLIAAQITYQVELELGLVEQAVAELAALVDVFVLVAEPTPMRQKKQQHVRL